MSEAIVYCDRCSHIISPADIRNGSALVSPNVAICYECSKKITPEQRARIVGTRAAPESGRSVAVRAAPRGVGTRRKALGPTTWGLVLAGAGAGVLAAIAMLLMSHDGDESTSAPAPTPDVRVPPTPAVPDTPRRLGLQAMPVPSSPSMLGKSPTGGERRDKPATPAERLARLRELVATSLENYDKFAAEAERLLADHPDAPEAQEARALMKDVEARRERQADADLAGAVEAAEGLIGAGRIDEVAVAFAYVRARYAGSEWLRSRGEPRIAEVIRQAEAARASSVQDTVATPTAAPVPASAAAPAAEVRQGRLAEGLVGYWRFDEEGGRTARDSSPNGNDGTLSGSPEWRPTGGRIGGGLFLRGVRSGDCVKVPDSPSLSPTEGLTLAAWVNGTTYPHVPNLIAKDGNNSFRWRIVWFDLADNKAKGFWLFLNDGANEDVAYVERAIMPGEWHHVAATADMARREVRVYVDGRPVGPPLATSRERIADTGGELIIGALDGWGNEPFHGLLDEVRVYDRALSSAEVAALAVFGEEHIIALAPTSRERERLMREGIASPETDGYHLTPKVIHNLTQRFDPARAKEKTLAAAGGVVAASSSFSALLRKELSRGDGYVLASSSGAAGRGMTHAGLRKKIARYLDRQRPEIVRICLDATDLAKGRTAADLRDDLSGIVDQVAEAGAVPVLFTLAMFAVEDAATRAVLDGYNRMVLDVAREKEVPCVDAFGILNRDDEARRAHFKPSGALRSEGLDAVNERFLKLYRVLEHWVLGRPSEAAAPGAPPGPRAPLAPPAAAANLVANGGFEEQGPNASLADGWQKGQWGTRGKRCSVRLDRANVRSGERSLEVRAIDEGAEPGAEAVLALEPGVYHIALWVLAEAGRTAELRARLAGEVAIEATAGEQWRRLTGKVKVTRRHPRTALQLAVTTPGVRVWIDDVEVVPAVGE